MVYRKVNPSVVYIENLTKIPNDSNPSDILPASEGRGFVWDAEGHIITNNHVVEGADALQVTFADGILLPAEVVGRDPDSDIAVVKIDPDSGHADTGREGKYRGSASGPTEPSRSGTRSGWWEASPQAL